MFALLLAVFGLVGARMDADTDQPYGLPGAPPNSQRVLNREFCRNSAAFAVTGAVEIAMERATGETVKLSEQEIVDCHAGGCGQTDVKDIVRWLMVVDRLAPADKYSPFQGLDADEEAMCRAGRAPNALTITLDGLVPVLDIELSLEEHGAVFACIDTRNDICPGYYKTKSGIEAGKGQKLGIYRDSDDDGIIDGYTKWYDGEGEESHVLQGEYARFCTHNVLIVGTHTSESGKRFWIVRDSRGDTWMRRGHFLVEIGSNACGIETNQLAALKAAPTTNQVGCPAGFPEWCEDLGTCTRTGQACVTPDNIFKGYDPDTNAPAKQFEWDFTGRPECQDKPGYEGGCKTSAATWRNCNSPAVNVNCAGSCLMCARDSCTDSEQYENECAKYAKYCFLDAVRAMCARTCGMHPNDCGTMQENIELLVGHDRPALGTCYPPEVPNGKVKNMGPIMSGDVIEIECDDGFLPTGKPNFCVVQDLFGPDSRIMEGCTNMLMGEGYTGRGADYMGNLNYNLEGTECVNWLEVALKGLYNWRDEAWDVNIGRAAVKGGNHNLCRNPDAAGITPFCFTYGINTDSDSYAGMELDAEEGAVEGAEFTAAFAEPKYCFDYVHCGGDHCAFSSNFDYFMCYLFDTSPEQCQAQHKSAGFMNDLCSQYCCSQAVKCPETPATQGPAFPDIDEFTDNTSTDEWSGGDSDWTGAGEWNGGASDWSGQGGGEWTGDDSDWSGTGGDSDWSGAGGDSDWSGTGGDSDWSGAGGDSDWSGAGGDSDWSEAGVESDWSEAGVESDWSGAGVESDWSGAGGETESAGADWTSNWSEEEEWAEDWSGSGSETDVMGWTSWS